MPAEIQLKLLTFDAPVFDDAKSRDILDQEIERLLEEVTQEAERRVSVKTPVGATSNLLGSVFGEVRGTPAREGVVGWNAPYGIIVEMGRRPGKFPPIGPIELWVRRKLGVPADRSRAVAFLVARKIARKGTKGQKIFERMFSEMQPVFQAGLNRMGERIAARLGGQGFGV